ncbi:hypothetical protein C0J52_00348 [Blattella germanica]|nr:hypothetical protein C0J52_00348 [Blattella germanica]
MASLQHQEDNIVEQEKDLPNVPTATTSNTIPTSCSQERNLGDMDSKVPTKYILKIILLGDANVGKTSIINRFINQSFMDNYQATIGIDFNTKLVQISRNVAARIHVYDLSGNERMANISKSYFRKTNGAFIVYDESNPSSMLDTLKWKQHLIANADIQDGSPLHCVLLGNKCDNITLTEERLTIIQKFVEDNEFSNFFSTSAKEDIGINEAFDFLIKEMAKTAKVNIESYGVRDEKINIAKENQENKKKFGCPCSLI